MWGANGIIITLDITKTRELGLRTSMEILKMNTNTFQAAEKIFSYATGFPLLDID